MKSLVVLIFFTLVMYSSRSQEVKKNTSKYPQAESGLKRQNLVVSVSGDDKVFIENKEIPRPKLDSVILSAINNKKRYLSDTVTLVINADTSTRYITVFEIMRSAKKAGARVVANINTGNQ